MDEKIWQGYLFDFYGELLTEHQRSIYEDYCLNDLSLSEIAESEGISRQGVHDLIKRCTKTLQGYEDKLHLVDKFIDIRGQINKINDLTIKKDESSYEDQMTEIRRIAKCILEEL